MGLVFNLDNYQYSLILDKYNNVFSESIRNRMEIQSF